MRRQVPGAFDEVYARYRETIWRFLRRLSGREGVAEDLFQDTWLAVARNAHRLREDTQLLPWLFTIARNKHRNGVRFRLFDRKRREQASAEPAAGHAEVEADADARRRAAKVAGAFARLPEVYREVLLLFFEEGLTTESVARILELREDAVRKRLSRARSELARLLELPEREGK
ncbi:MAG: RNA polymerase sigma factor [Deltaproteobacteria bacterium]